MAWNGSGVFSRLYNWVVDRDAEVKIQAQKMDDEMDGFATGIQACLTKNGENAAEADLPMATYRHTNVGNSSARNHYAVTGQVQDCAYNYAAASGTDTITAVFSPSITAYSFGPWWLKIANTNTGAVTLNFNGIGAKSAVKGVSTALTAGDLPAGALVGFAYNSDNDNFQLIAVSFDGSNVAITGGTITGTYSLSTTGDAGTVDGLNASQFIRSDANDTVSGHTEWQDGFQARFGSSADMELMHSGGQNYIDINVGDLYVRSGTTTRYLFDVSSGNFHADGNLLGDSTSVGSDIRFKDNIQTIPNALEAARKIRGVLFNYKKNGMPGASVVAQEAEAAFPVSVHEVPLLDGGETRKYIKEEALIGLLFQALNELADEVDKLK